MLNLLSFLTGGGNRIKLNRQEYIRVGFWLMVIILLFVLFAFEVKYFSNTFHIKSLVKRALLFGLFAGAGISYWLTKDKPDMEMLLKFQLWVAMIIGCILLMPLFASLTNRYLAFGKSQDESVELVKVEGFYADRYGLLEKEAPPSGYHIFIIKDGQLERIKSTIDPFPNKKEGEMVLLKVYNGFWGYDWVRLK